MNIKLSTIIIVIASTCAITACQTVPDSTSKSSPATLVNFTKTVETKAAPIIDIGVLEYLDSDNDGVFDHLYSCPGTPADVVIDNRGCPIAVEPIGYLMMELRVFYEHNSYELQVKFSSEIAKVAEKMNAHPEQIFVLSGHTSAPEAAKISVNIDGKINNVDSKIPQLGRKRAQVIKEALINQGIAANRIYTFDCADDMPIASNDSKEGKRLNQRTYGEIKQKSDLYTSKISGQGYSFDYYKSYCQQF